MFSLRILTNIDWQLLVLSCNNKFMPDKPGPEYPENIERLLNPKGLKHPYLTGIAIGAVSAYGAGIVISGWLHRSTHGGVEYSEVPKRAWRGANLMLTGMPKFDWVDHLAHHAYPDQEDTEAQAKWNESRPEGAPEAPIEAFRDPYSVVLEERADKMPGNGYRKVMFNTSGLHRRAKKAIVPFLQELDRSDKEHGRETREHWPKHFMNVDMEEGNPNAIRNKYPWAGLVALGALETVVFGPKVAAPAMATHIIAMLGMGGDINSINHTGQKSGVINRAKVLLGKEKPVPDEKGEYAADLLPGKEFIVLGEPRHKQHHDKPADPYLAKDPVSWIIRALTRLGLAKTPGAES